MKRIAVVIAMALATFVAPVEEAAAGPAELEAVVLLSRHSTRSPLLSDGLANFTNQTWPDFGVLPGYLTPQGKKASVAMGKYYGKLFRSSGLLPAKGCLPAKQVGFRADVSQRTIATAKGLRRGMFPKCDYPVNVSPGEYDPVISPGDAGICPTVTNTQSIENAVNAATLAKVGGSWTPTVDAYMNSLETVQKAVQWNAPTICKGDGLHGNCKLVNLPTDDGRSGPIVPATTISEVFLMEYATGMPLKNVAWGRDNTPQQISFMSKTHATAFWASNSNPYVAGRAGSNLANWILKKLKRAAVGRGQKVSVIVAHDNNLINVAGLLGANWFLQGYQQHQVPPGTVIAFELWRDTDTDKLSVSVVFRAQTLTQLRNAKALKGSNSPSISDVTDTICGSQTVDGMCPFKKFRKIMSSGIVPACVGQGKPAGQ